MENVKDTWQRHAFTPAIQLKRGAVDVGAPMQNEIIQIGASGETQPTRLIVANGFRTIRIFRQDQQPLQVEMDAVDSAYQVERIHVFTEPIDEVLIRRELLNSTWNLLNDPGLISRQKSFWDFVSFTIGKAEEKQLRSEW